MSREDAVTHKVPFYNFSHAVQQQLCFVLSTGINCHESDQSALAGRDQSIANGAMRGGATDCIWVENVQKELVKCLVICPEANANACLAPPATALEPRYVPTTSPGWLNHVSLPL